MAKERGRPPKLAVHKQVDGNPGKRPIDPPPELNMKPLGYAPDGTPPPEREVWNAVRRECPWLIKSDTMLIQEFCRWWVIKDAAQRRLLQLTLNSVRLSNVRIEDEDERRAIVAMSAGDDKMIGQLQRMADRAAERCESIMIQIGLTPLSREKVSKLLNQEDHPQSTAARFLG